MTRRCSCLPSGIWHQAGGHWTSFGLSLCTAFEVALPECVWRILCFHPSVYKALVVPCWPLPSHDAQSRKHAGAAFSIRGSIRNPRETPDLLSMSAGSFWPLLWGSFYSSSQNSSLLAFRACWVLSALPRLGMRLEAHWVCGGRDLCGILAVPV